MPRWTCPECLAAFEPSARFARCDHGCDPKTDSPAPTFVFDPRAGQSSGPRLAPTFLLAARTEPRALCPRCGRPTARWVCPACHADLPDDGNPTVASLVVVGPPGSGKTGLTRAIARRLERMSTQAVVDPHDEASRGFLAGKNAERDRVQRVILHERRRVGEGTSSRWLTIFDCPGGPWEERKDTFARDAGFLARAGVIVLAVDPRRLEPVIAEIRRNPGAGVEPGPLSTWRRYQLVDEIRLLGSFVEAAGGRLPFASPVAVALTRVETWSGLASPGTLLKALGPVPEAFPWADSVSQRLHDEAEAELVRWNGESFLQQLGLKFPVHRFVPVGDPATPAPFGLDSLLSWILERQGWR